MINLGVSERTNVYVVGAGASKEFGLPTGRELQDIIKKFATFDLGDFLDRDGDRLLLSCFGANEDKYFAAQTIAENMPLAPSIDNFLHTHKDNKTIVEVGKLLIARSILNAEKHSTLFADQRNGPNRINFSRGERKNGSKIITPAPNYSWLAELFRLLVAEKEFAEFLEAIRNITFISFNYDRCIVQFILFAAKQYFTLSNPMLEDLHKAIEVIHPYGSLGEISIQNQTISGFGSDVDHLELFAISKRIKTFTEQTEQHIQDQIQDRFDSCQIAIFLGFGFLPLNMKFLFEGKKYGLRRVLGTSLGLSEETSQIISGEIERTLNTNMRNGYVNSQNIVEMAPVTCRELFTKHYRYLQTIQKT